MEDPGNAVDGAAEVGRVAEIALDQVDRPDGVEILVPSGHEVVQHPHAVAPFQQCFRDVRSDEPRAAGDEVETSLSHAATLRNAHAGRKLKSFAVAHGEWHVRASCA